MTELQQIDSSVLIFFPFRQREIVEDLICSLTVSHFPTSVMTKGSSLVINCYTQGEDIIRRR
jgi:hypothetical protein